MTCYQNVDYHRHACTLGQCTFPGKNGLTIKSGKFRDKQTNTLELRNLEREQLQLLGHQTLFSSNYTTSHFPDFWGNLPGTTDRVQVTQTIIRAIVKF